MTSITGLTPPLHRRFNEKDSLRQIRDRYIGLREQIPEQVRLLQSDDRFLKRCENYYRDGYKDWHILSAILNLMIHFKNRELGNSLRTPEERERSKETPKLVKGQRYPVEEFLTNELDMHFTGHALTCLARYGFESRVSILASEPMIKFLRQRMRHFDLDIPHTPMFGHPPGDWPKL